MIPSSSQLAGWATVDTVDEGFVKVPFSAWDMTLWLLQQAERTEARFAELRGLIDDAASWIENYPLNHDQTGEWSALADRLRGVGAAA